MASEAYNIQKLANQSAKEIQQMVNSANKTSLNFNKTEAATARKFEKEMSNTSHQREVADLKKAGLNPVLSANSGAMSYTGASASAQAESGASSMSGLYGSLMNSITGLKQSQMSADAQLRTAQLSAAATRYAAQQSASAQKYAADKAYQREMDKPQTSPFALGDKYGTKLWNWFKDKGFDKKSVSKAYEIGQGLQKFRNKQFKTSHLGLKSPEVIREVDKGLNVLGYNQYFLNHLSDRQRYSLRQDFIYAFYYKESKALESSFSNKIKK